MHELVEKLIAFRQSSLSADDAAFLRECLKETDFFVAAIREVAAIRASHAGPFSRDPRETAVRRAAVAAGSRSELRFLLCGNVRHGATCATCLRFQPSRRPRRRRPIRTPAKNRGESQEQRSRLRAALRGCPAGITRREGNSIASSASSATPISRLFSSEQIRDFPRERPT